LVIFFIADIYNFTDIFIAGFKKITLNRNSFSGIYRKIQIERIIFLSAN